MNDLLERFRTLDGLDAPDLRLRIRGHRPTRPVEEPPWRRWTAAVIALALAGGGLTVAARAFFGREEPRPAITAEPTTPGTTLDPTEPVTLEFEGVDRMNAVVTGFGSVWATEWTGEGAPSLLRIDPDTGEVLVNIRVSTTPFSVFGGGGLASGDGSVWIAGTAPVEGKEQGVLVRVDPQVDTEAEVIPLGGDLAGDVALGLGAIWVTYMPEKGETRDLLRVNPATYEVVARIPLDRTSSLEDIILASGSVWIPEYGVEGSRGTVLTRIDPQTNTITGRVDLGTSGELAVFEDELWALTPQGFLRIDPANAMAGPEAVPVQGEPVGGPTGPRGKSSEAIYANVAPGAGGLWFVQEEEGRLVVSRFNPETESIDASVDLPPQTWSPQAMAISGDAIWVVDRGNLVHRVPLPPEIAG